MKKFIASAKGRANGNNPFPDGKSPVITVIHPKKKTPAKKPKAPAKKSTAKKPTGKTKTTKKKSK